MKIPIFRSRQFYLDIVSDSLNGSVWGAATPQTFSTGFARVEIEAGTEQPKKNNNDMVYASQIVLPLFFEINFTIFDLLAICFCKTCRRIEYRPRYPVSERNSEFTSVNRLSSAVKLDASTISSSKNLCKF